jgi:flagellar hook-associated protein 1 FlgK
MIRGTFLGIEVAKRGLFSARVGLDTTSHNIANANTEGYSRQRAVLRSSFPLAFSGPFVTLRPGQVGTGVEVSSITRIRSSFIEAQLHREGGDRSMYSVMSQHFRNVEDIVGEPSEYAINALMEGFFDAWEDLSNDPESASARANLRSSAQAFTDFVNEVDFKLNLELTSLNEEIRERVGRVNYLSQEVAELNRQIIQIEGSGTNESLKANDLKDRRDIAIEEMSSLVNARVIYNQNGGVSVLVRGHPLVGGTHVNEISLKSNPDDFYRPEIVFTKSRIPLAIDSGELQGLMRMRDEEIPSLRQNLSEVVSVFTNRVNMLHRQGYGLDESKNRPFFVDTEHRRISGTFLLPAGTTLDTTLYDLGITSGDFFVQGTRVLISDDEVMPDSATTLGDIFARIEEATADLRFKLEDSGGNPRVLLRQFNPADNDDELSIKGGTSSFFNILGLAGAPVETISGDPQYVNALYNFKVSSSVLNDLDTIAATGDDGLGYPGPGDNRTALAIADLKNKSLDVFGTTFSEHYQSAIAQLGSVAYNAERSYQSQQLVVEQLDARRQEVSGVNLDEEAVNLIRFQKAFEASSRALTILDEILNTIINRLGTVGR